MKEPQLSAKHATVIFEAILDCYFHRQAAFLILAPQLNDLGLKYLGNFGHYHDPASQVAVVDAFSLRKEPSQNRF
jgi:hypothetical protein